MTTEELWEHTHKKMINQLTEVLPVINDDSDDFIDLDWCDATGEFNVEWIRTMLVNIKNEQRMDEVIELIASCYRRMYMNGERAAYANNMPEYGAPKHQDIMRLMEACHQLALSLPVQVKSLIISIKGSKSTAAELQLASGLSPKSKDHFKKQFLNPAIEAGLVSMTHPDNPRHPQQSKS